MKIRLLIILWLGCIALPLKSDILYLNNGEQINGELIRVTSVGLIFEIRQNAFILDCKTFNYEDVLKVLDDNGIILFQSGQLLVPDLSDYYMPPRKLSSIDAVQDTLELINQSRSIVYIKDISNEYVFYFTKKNRNEIQKIPKDQIYRINGQPMEKYQRVSPAAPSTRYLSYPYLSVEVGYGLITTHLGSLSGLKIDTSGSANPLRLRSVANNYNCLQLSLLLHIFPYLSASIVGHFSEGFSGNAENDEDVDESFYLAVAELHLTYPNYFIKPWLGIGWAHQSLTIITSTTTDATSVDIIWKSHSSGLAFSGGLDFKITDIFQFYIAGRSMPFTSKPITSISNTKIDLANTVYSAGIKIIL
jgi:opacity protein-like surface antigen